MNQVMSLVQSTAFLQWFDQSKIVNHAGLPQILYHGTGHSIIVLEPMRGAIFMTPDPRLAYEFAENSATEIDESNGYDQDIYGERESAGANIIPLFVSCQNPFDPRNAEHVDQLVQELTSTGQLAPDPDGHYRSQLMRGCYDILEDHYDTIKSLGFDGFYEKEHESNAFWNIGVFDSNQVKSVFNCGSFNANSKLLIE